MNEAHHPHDVVVVGGRVRLDVEADEPISQSLPRESQMTNGVDTATIDAVKAAPEPETSRGVVERSTARPAVFDVLTTSVPVSVTVA
ncbi:hypothetical protein Drose_21800 [Dactylosporangium roseum]|uniref:Uncharacterized protein n=1 Tax=Dactylosporangium roseum TaxID=47989 RepID=A0ABY5YWK1_9ACTN|nr:hypothetical protein [Dactylosporangium roseum]UWZ33902.1 hypothetical protein Drose_21800 [Dactylosporangium roseum]